jgi:hypothetical protein
MSATDMPLEKSRKVVGGLALCLAMIAIVLNFIDVYYMGGSGTADFLWNENEGYLFVHGGRQGYRFSYLGYLAEMIKEPLGLVPSIDNQKAFTIIFHMTPSNVKQYELPNTFEYYTPIDHAVYAAHEGSLWKWMGSRFEAATAEENQQVHGIARLVREDFNEVNGWSGRYSITSERSNRIATDIGKKPLTLSVKTLNAVDGEVSIDVATPGRPDETIYRMSFRARRVPKAEYDKAFGGS